MTDIPPSTAPTSVALTRRWREVPVIVGLVLEARRERQRGRQRLGGAAVALSKVQSVTNGCAWERGLFGPIGASCTTARLRHLMTVFRLRP